LRVHVRTSPFLDLSRQWLGGGLALRRRLRRSALLLTIVCAHLLAIAWLATRVADQPEQPKRDPVLELVTVLVNRSPAKPPPPAESQATAVRPPTLLPTPMAEPAASSPPSEDVAGVGGQCPIAEGVRAAVMQDAEAMAELASVPPGARTQADAVMVWNGEWRNLAAPQPQAQAQAMSPLRRIIVGVIEASTPECRDAVIVGPLFISIPEADRTTTLVVGSGAWRWSDLLATDPVCVAGWFQTCPEVPAAPRR
jgi:hypothetical protein